MCLQFPMKIHTMLWVLWLIQATPNLVASQSGHGSPNTKHIKKRFLSLYKENNKERERNGKIIKRW